MAWLGCLGYGTARDLKRIDREPLEAGISLIEGYAVVAAPPKTKSPHPPADSACRLPVHVAHALDTHTYFKVIVGGSFNELGRVAQLARVFAMAGAHALDVSAHPAVVQATLTALDTLPADVARPMVMASFPLDDDPHFRKIQLNRPDCIDCGACLPVCPTRVFDLDAVSGHLRVDEPLCYGCGRCLPVCPTTALDLDAFVLRDGLVQVLADDRVESVEIHSAQADCYLIERCFDDLGPLLAGKYISFCYRPAGLETAHNRAVVETLSRLIPGRFMIQVDGNPMSATSDAQSSRPAIEAALALSPLLRDYPQVDLTVSGGINAHTAHWLRQTMDSSTGKIQPIQVIQGLGMGTFARHWVWDALDASAHPDDAIEQARALLAPFCFPSRHSPC